MEPDGSLVISNASTGGLVKYVGVGCLVFGGLPLVYLPVQFLTGTTPLMVVLTAVFGGLFVAMGIGFVRSARKVAGSGFRIGPAGLEVWQPSGRATVPWIEIPAVGVSIVSSGGDGPGRPGLRGRSVIRIRFAAPTRHDLAFLATTDEPAPYTHLVGVLPSTPLGPGRFDPVAGVDAALRRWAGATYTGVEQRQVAVGRYR